MGNQRRLDAQEAARRLDCTPEAIDRLARSGAFPGAVRFSSGTWSIPPADVRRFSLRKPGKPPRNEAVTSPGARFYCQTMRCELAIRGCVIRQQKSDGAVTTDGERGQAPVFVTCRTDRCEQGRANRQALGDLLLRKHRRGWVPLRRGRAKKGEPWISR